MDECKGRWRLAGGIGILLAGTALASAQATAETASQIEEIQVFSEGSRLPANITSVPGSVTIVDAKSIAQQSAISSDLGKMLASVVPGLSVSSGDGNNFSQTLRGRKPSFFIDGIPQSADLRGGGRDLRIVNPNVLERIEVINGATSIYGLGGSGGVVNYITKRPDSQGVNFISEVGIANSLSHASSNGLEYSLSQGISGRQGKIDFVGNVSYVSRGLQYDANGDPLPPDPTGQTGIADSGERSLFGKIGVQVTDNIRWEAMAVDYKLDVDTDYTVGQGSFARGIKSIATPKRKNNFLVSGLRFDFIGTEDPSTRNTLGSTSLIFDNVLGDNTVKLDAYAKYSKFVWRYISFLSLAPTSGGFPPDGSQLKTFDARQGARVDIRTPFEFPLLKGTVLWGGEYAKDTTTEKLVDGRPRTSRISQDSKAVFAQLQGDIRPWLHVRTGIRYDDFDLKIPSFRALDYYSATLTHQVIGADLSYSSVTGNFGLVGDLTENVSLFGSWSSGFSIGNVVRAISGLRPSARVTTPVTYNIANLGLTIKPVKVNSYEGGVRYKDDRFTASATGFFNKSQLGASFNPTTLAVVRAPEEIWGYELAGSVKIFEPLTVGGSYTRVRSHTDGNNDGTWEAQLDFSRVPPAILNAYVEAKLPVDGWSARLQSATLFSEKRFNAPYGQLQRDTPDYTTFDLYFSGPVGRGTLSIGFENILNRQYYPLGTYMNCADNVLFDAFCATTAPGARGSLRYSIKY